jgi:DNA mismatch repair protein MutS
VASKRVFFGLSGLRQAARAPQPFHLRKSAFICGCDLRVYSRSFAVILENVDFWPGQRTYCGRLEIVSMTFYSILFPGAEDPQSKEVTEVPSFFKDMNLNQVIDAITAGKEAYNLKPLFYTCLPDIEVIGYRHQVLRDLEDEVLFANMKSFAQEMDKMREHLTQASKATDDRQKQRWFLDGVGIYCTAIDRLARDLSVAKLNSTGLAAFREYLSAYVSSNSFKALTVETDKLQADLASIRYSTLILGSGTFKVSKFRDGLDYRAEVERTFEKFKQGPPKEYKYQFPNLPHLNVIEAKILEFVTQLYPEIFAHLTDYCARYGNYEEKPIQIFEREIQFYVSFLDYVETFRRAGLKFCYPKITTDSKEIYSDGGFDIALASRLVAEGTAVVCNDFYFKDPERIFVVTGPNQGGKTTFSRQFGQVHYLAGIGVLVPGRTAKVHLFDCILTHYERDEYMTNLQGKLQDDVVRIHEILERATPKSIIILNEIFSSTALQDALFLSKRVMEKIIELDALCVWVTFVDELASYSEKVVSMVSTVVPDNPAVRTYKVFRKPAEGVAYALTIAEKYGLTYDRLKDRISL